MLASLNRGNRRFMADQVKDLYAFPQLPQQAPTSRVSGDEFRSVSARLRAITGRLSGRYTSKSDLDLLRNAQGIIDLNADVMDCALNRPSRA
jgi:hypothetical protein